ncbi:MFS transporter [Rubrivivax sp. A210]|uniref:MFS transporter n=1 Tax=Rubrivivax sp. A210 TaxID=2772301 RepID=UPI00191B340E|nr:MFS transporter [Rubrivivax sp. A210]CAD5366446.1 MFS transporter [Rubrivivax sp. A210]
MSTVVVARKGGTLAIASDSLVSFGETRLPPGYEANDKMFEVAGSVVGAVGSTAHMPVLRQALTALAPEERRLDTRDGLFETFVRLHPRLKDHFFLNTKEQDSDPYESSQFSILIANVHGIWGVESYREVFEFERFWAIGSGRRFALGAMHAAYDRARSAREVAEAGVAAGCEFDTSSAGPVRLHTFKLKQKG